MQHRTSRSSATCPLHATKHPRALQCLRCLPAAWYKLHRCACRAGMAATRCSTCHGRGACCSARPRRSSSSGSCAAARAPRCSPCSRSRRGGTRARRGRRAAWSGGWTRWSAAWRRWPRTSQRSASRSCMAALAQLELLARGTPRRSTCVVAATMRGCCGLAHLEQRPRALLAHMRSCDGRCSSRTLPLRMLLNAVSTGARPLDLPTRDVVGWVAGSKGALLPARGLLDRTRACSSDTLVSSMRRQLCRRLQCSHGRSRHWLMKPHGRRGVSMQLRSRRLCCNRSQNISQHRKQARHQRGQQVLSMCSHHVGVRGRVRAQSRRRACKRPSCWMRHQQSSAGNSARVLQKLGLELLEARQSAADGTLEMNKQWQMDAQQASTRRGARAAGSDQRWHLAE